MKNYLKDNHNCKKMKKKKKSSKKSLFSKCWCVGLSQYLKFFSIGDLILTTDMEID